MPRLKVETRQRVMALCRRRYSFDFIHIQLAEGDIIVTTKTLEKKYKERGTNLDLHTKGKAVEEALTRNDGIY